MPTEKDYTEWAEAFETGTYRAIPVEEPQIDSYRTGTSMFVEHDVIELARDLPALGLRAGAVGAIVGIYETGGYEVEFTTATGHTPTVVPLSSDDLRPGRDQEHAFYARPENQTPQGPGRRRTERS